MDRESLIEQLALVTGYNKSAYEKMTDEELKQEMKRLYGSWNAISYRNDDGNITTYRQSDESAAYTSERQSGGTT